jgi:signal transduction histidine kinase
MYLTFWHVIYLGVLSVMLWYAWTTFGTAQPWRAAALTVLIAGQASLYLWNFIFNEVWPLPRWRITFYFLGSGLLWLLEWRLDPTFQWIGATYFGQMMGTLPPLAALPASLIVFSLVFIVSPDFKFGLADLTSGRTIGPLLGWAASIVFYLFVFFITRTSTARGRLLAELRAAQAELEAAHARDTELAALRERERLARDLHDSLGHALVAISVQLEAIQRLYRVDPERAHAQVDTLKDATRAAMDELRRSLQGLRAPGLGDRPLADALRSLAVETGQQHNLEVACHIDPAPAAGLAPGVAEVLWRVAQEALTNVARHAQARHVDRPTLTPAAAAQRAR